MEVLMHLMEVTCFMQELALDAVQTVQVDLGNGLKDIDIKNYAKVEKIPGGTIEDCRVLQGVMC
jgi:T-complex protein 1 subunit gamma